MPVKINGATSGSVTLAAPATGTDVTLTLPASSGTVALTASPTFTGSVVWSSATLRADTATVDTQQTTTSTSYTDLATSGPAVTLTTGTKALVLITVDMLPGTAATGQDCSAAFAVSGATTRSAADAERLYVSAPTGATYGPEMRATAAILVTNLTAGSNTFTLKYKVNAGTGIFRHRAITVVDMGS